jgi:hypothetical protein
VSIGGGVVGAAEGEAKVTVGAGAEVEAAGCGAQAAASASTLSSVNKRIKLLFDFLHKSADVGIERLLRESVMCALCQTFA